MNKTLKDLVEENLKDIYSAEKQFLKAMPKLQKTAQSQRLKDAIGEHIKQTEGHVQRLEEVAKIMGIKPTGMVCQAAKGLVEEVNEHLKEAKPSPVTDALIIECAQKNEHYEIASYGTLCEWGKALGEQQWVNILKQTMGEEEQTDKMLSQIAESEVNPAAAKVEKQTIGKATADKSPRAKVSMR